MENRLIYKDYLWYDWKKPDVEPEFWFALLTYTAAADTLDTTYLHLHSSKCAVD